MSTIRFSYRVILMLAAVVLVSPIAQADRMIDNFETYKKGQVIGKSWDSTPWRRFGSATNDNIYATGVDGMVVAGRRSGQYGAFWPNRFGAVRFVFKSSADLNEFNSASAKIRSSKPTTNTRVKLAISNGETTYISAVGQTLTNKIQQIGFSLDPADMVLADGSDGYADVVTNAKMIGFDFTSTEGQYTESILFDDFGLHSPGQGGDGDGGSEW